MKTYLSVATFALVLALTWGFAAPNADAACAQKLSRDPSYIELAVPEGTHRPAGVADFKDITDDTTVDQLIAKVGVPDASQGSTVTQLIWCFDDGTELSLGTRDRVVIEWVRHKGHVIYKRKKK